MEEFVKNRVCLNKKLVNTEFRAFKEYTIDNGVIAKGRPPKDTFSPNVFGKQVDDDDLINHPAAWMLRQSVSVGMPPRCVAQQQDSMIVKKNVRKKI